MSEQIKTLSELLRHCRFVTENYAGDKTTTMPVEHLAMLIRQIGGLELAYRDMTLKEKQQAAEIKRLRPVAEAARCLEAWADGYLLSDYIRQPILLMHCNCVCQAVCDLDAKAAGTEEDAEEDAEEVTP